MTTLSTDPASHHAGFAVVAHAFLAGEGLPFSAVLTAQDMEAAFAEHHALFAAGDRALSSA
jgi:hypothetical protein